MLVRDTFATTIQQLIEPVVKVGDCKPSVVLDELRNLVVTRQWERHLYAILDLYSDAAERDAEAAVGIWVSGFFGSGKSLLIKVLGALLEDVAIDGQSAHDIFLQRLPTTSADRSNIARFLTICKRKLSTTVVGGNLHTMQAFRNDSLALLAFRLFADARGFTQYWALAWTIEYQIDERGKSAEFRQRVADLSSTPWEEIRRDAEIYLDTLYAAAVEVMPDHFRDVAAVDRCVSPRGCTCSARPSIFRRLLTILRWPWLINSTSICLAYALRRRPSWRSWL